MSFEEYCAQEKSVLEQGLYAEQLKRYFDRFQKSQILVCINEDSKNDPRAYIQNIYSFLGVRSDFVPSMLHHEINVSRVPRYIGPEKTMHRFSEFLRRHGMDRFVHRIRRSGLPDMLRHINTKAKKQKKPAIDRTKLIPYFKADVEKVSEMLGRDLNEFWDII
jgi:hypothetical protein